MKAAVLDSPYEIRLADVPDATLIEDTDAVVDVLVTCVCGSDLWPYRGESPREPSCRMGHEFIGRVTQSGRTVASVRSGDVVIAPFKWSDGTCTACRDGAHAQCRRGGLWGSPGSDGAQGTSVRVPFADGTLVTVPPDVAKLRMPSLLALTDVMSTGWYCAERAGVSPGDTVAVVGDGAVGLCAVLAARHLGAERVIALSSRPSRQLVAESFGADVILSARGADAERQVLKLTAGRGVDAVLECVGTAQSLETALGAVRPGGSVGFVGVPQQTSIVVRRLFDAGISLAGGIAPARELIPRLLPLVTDGTLDLGAVFDAEFALVDIAAAYRVMDERVAIKSLVRVGDL